MLFQKSNFHSCWCIEDACEQGGYVGLQREHLASKLCKTQSFFGIWEAQMQYFLKVSKLCSLTWPLEFWYRWRVSWKSLLDSGLLELYFEYFDKPSKLLGSHMSQPWLKQAKSLQQQSSLSTQLSWFLHLVSSMVSYQWCPFALDSSWLQVCSSQPWFTHLRSLVSNRFVEELFLSQQLFWASTVF